MTFFYAVCHFPNLSTYFVSLFIISNLSTTLNLSLSFSLYGLFYGSFVSIFPPFLVFPTSVIDPHYFNLFYIFTKLSTEFSPFFVNFLINFLKFFSINCPHPI
jgi:hypothetical protein